MKLTIKPNEFRHVIKEIRLSRYETLEQFAKTCNITHAQFLHNLESGLKPTSFKTLEKVCKACNVELSVNIKMK